MGDGTQTYGEFCYPREGVDVETVHMLSLSETRAHTEQGRLDAQFGREVCVEADDG